MMKFLKPKILAIFIILLLFILSPLILFLHEEEGETIKDSFDLWLGDLKCAFFNKLLGR